MTPKTIPILAILVVACTAGQPAVPEQAAPPRPPPADAPTTINPPPLPTTQPAVDPTYVVWSPDGLPSDFQEGVSGLSGVLGVTVVEVGNLHIVETRDSGGRLVDRPPPGFVIPVEGVVLQADSYAGLIDPMTAALIGSLGPDEIVLGSSSAALRRLGVGARIVFEGGGSKAVAAVVGDEEFGTAEVLAVGEPFSVENSQRQYALVRYAGDLARLEEALAAIMPQESVFRVRQTGVGGARRRAILPQLAIKQTFGEFAYRPTSRGRFDVDPQWRAANIISVDLPLLGRTQCHRIFGELLADVMNDVIAAGLEELIDPDAFHGCWVSRYIAGTARLSRHAFGAAADINFGNSLDGGPGSPVNQHLLEAMAAAGITSGHIWARPDPGHFEYYGLDLSDPVSGSDMENARSGDYG